ncbi:MAG: TIGR03088 family PEP-CTERM/XrtA system glycosyltransferase [Candidatus Binatia bacterium]
MSSVRSHVGQDCSRPPLVLHVIFRLAVGGLENGLVNLINMIPEGRYRHAIVSLTDYTDFRYRIRRANVPVVALYKREGKDLRVYARFWRVIRELRPAIVHTRNWPTLEFVALAALAGVRGRVHGEHGREIYDVDGSNVKYNMSRRIVSPLVSQYIAVSNDLANWLRCTVKIPDARVSQIYNGVDIGRFAPASGQRRTLAPEGFLPPRPFIVGTVGRMQTVKDQMTLVRAFLHILTTKPALRDSFRLVLIGDGPLRTESHRLLREAKAVDLAWLPGERDEIPDILRGLDVFVLPSVAEGISNTILEAMASGLPVVATRVGGNPELVEDGRSGMLVPASDPVALANALLLYAAEPHLCKSHGQAGRARVESQFSLEAMANNYMNVYDKILL